METILRITATIPPVERATGEATQTPVSQLPGTPTIASPTPSVTNTPEPTATLPPFFSLCSPFTEIPRENLYKIVSVPYKPPPLGVDEKHQGVDFVFHRLAGVDHTILGVPIQSVLAGKVAASVVDSFPYGNLVIVETLRNALPEGFAQLVGIQPGESLYHLYAHMLEAPQVEIGQEVEICEVIGLVGASGNTEAPHLHFETRIGPEGNIFPEMSAYVKSATEESRKFYQLWRVSKVFRHFDPMILLEYLMD